MSAVKKLYEERNRVWEEQKALNDTAVKEDRDLSTEEQETWNSMDADFNRLTDEIRAAETVEQKKLERAKAIEERDEYMKSAKHEPIKPNPETRTEKKEMRIVNPRATDEYRSAFRSFLLNGYRDLPSLEKRALQSDSDVAGGFVVAPEQWVNELIQAKDNMVFVRRFARVISVAKAASLGVPVLDTDPAAPVWTAEIKTGNEDNSMAFEKRDLYPHPLAKRIKISEKLLRASTINIEALVRERLAYQFAITEESAFMTGTGANQPLGIFTASDSGITTARDVSTGATTTAIKADQLINCKYTLTAQYRTNCRWIFHRDAISMIRKLKDGNSQYLWKAGISSDRPDTILDFPVHESEYCPNTFSSALYVGILGDFSFYWIADALDMTVKVLNELYAETGQIGYIGRAETDAMPVHETAFVRVKLA